MTILEAKLKIADLCMETAGAMPFDELSILARNKVELIAELEDLQSQCEFVATEFGDIIEALS